MIKINLVSERKQARGKSPGGLSLDAGANTQSLVLASVLIAGFAGAGLWGWTTANRLADVRQAHVEADAELKRLEEVRKRGDEYTARKDLLARKIGIITDLKKKQEVPVHILDQVSKNIPDFLWLDTMSARENAINLAGKATTYNAVSSFYKNLTSSGYFADVTLGKTFEVSEGVAFSVTARFAPPQSVEPAAEADGQTAAVEKAQTVKTAQNQG